MKTKMRTAIVISMVYTLCALSPALGQTPDKYVQVGDTTINLADVDLEKGMVIEKKEYSLKNDISKGVYGNYFFNITLKLFTSYNQQNYAIIYDTIVYHGYGLGFDSRILYYSHEDELLFDNYLEGFGVYRCFISSTGKVIIADLTYDNAGEFRHVYNNNGELIKTYHDQYGRFYFGSLNDHFFLCNHNDYKGPNTYDLIDRSGNIEEVVFPDGFLRGISFSPRENYYIVRIGSDRLSYSISNQLIWSIPKKNMGSINITLDEKKYMTRNYNNHAIEAKDLLSHEIIYSIDSVVFGDEQLPIYRWNIIDSSFYTIGKKDSTYIYNFYNADGAVIKTVKVPVIKRTKPYVVSKQGDKFIIEPRKRNE